MSYTSLNEKSSVNAETSHEAFEEIYKTIYEIDCDYGVPYPKRKAHENALAITVNMSSVTHL